MVTTNSYNQISLDHESCVAVRDITTMLPLLVAPPPFGRKTGGGTTLRGTTGGLFLWQTYQTFLRWLGHHKNNFLLGNTTGGQG